MRLAIFIYPDLDGAACERYWSRKLGIKKLHKTQMLPSRSKKERLPHGVCTIVVCNTYLKVKMNTWIDHLTEMVLNTVPQKRKK